MKFFRLVIIYTVTIVAALFMATFGVDPKIAFSVVLVVALIMAYTQIHILFVTKNLKRLDEYVTQQKNPMFRHLNAIAHGTIEDQLDAIDAILARYKQPMIQHTYLFTKAILLENFEVAEAAAKQIPKEPNRSYSLAYVEALKGNASEARAYTINKPWMLHAIEALIACEAKDKLTFEAEATKSIESARGVQYYQLVHGFKNMKF